MDVNTPTGIVGNANDAAITTFPKSRILQNVGTGSVFVRYGTGASLILYHVVLKPGTAFGDGLGGVLIVPGSKWAGPLSWVGVAAQVVITRFT